ncbi:oligosaccharide flippase family protein [Vibrio penaeicida]|uniref:lipopolysaccharide biosynthesis protein n=1 Tax=Vibrio penaeicida TaxID=104609 RepID=UPI0027347A51|nr:oligosaccharide flippase family protein [Vibrio penaeicida]MDP2571215.1 oligosaccharide flippase family protein [Vibrio penaeicida]
MKALAQSAYYAIGIIMMKGVSLMMIPYLTRKLSVVEYGSLEILLLLADIGTIMFSFGIINAMYRYVGTAEGEHKRALISNCFTLSVLFSGIGAIIIFITLPLLIRMLPAAFESYQIVLLAIPILLDGLITIPMTLMRMNDLAKRFCVLNVMKALGQALMTFILLEAGYGIDAVLISCMVSSVLLMLCLLGYQKQEMGSFGQLKYSKLLLKFALPTLGGFLCIYMITGLDRWLLASFTGVEELAVYAIAVKFALILGLALEPYALWWFPNRIALLQQYNGKQICADNAMLGTNLGIYLGMLMILTVPGFITLALPPDYHMSATLVVGLILVNMIKTAGDYLNLGCFSGDSSQAQMWIQCACAVFAVAGYVWLVPQFGVIAVIAVLGGAYSVRLMLIYLVSQQKEPLPYRHANLVKSIMIAFSAWQLHQWLDASLTFFPSIVLGMIVSVLATIGFLLFGIIPIPESLKIKLSNFVKSHMPTAH